MAFLGPDNRVVMRLHCTKHLLFCNETLNSPKAPWKHCRPIAKFKVLVVQNIFWRRKDFCFYCMFKKTFWAQQTLGGTQKFFPPWQLAWDIEANFKNPALDGIVYALEPKTLPTLK